MKKLFLAALLALAPTLLHGSDMITLSAGGTLGVDKGGGLNGVLVGALAKSAPAKAILRSVSADVVCTLYDTPAYGDDTTDCNDAGTGDVPFLPATPANGDAFKVGRVGKKFSSVDFVISTQGAGTWTITWKYWDGDSWAELSGVTDGTTGFTAAAGTVTVSFTQPSDWAQNTENGTLAYWIEGEVSAYSAVTTQPVGSVVRVIGAVADADFTDDTTDFNSAGAGDVALLPATLHVGDAFFVGGGTEKFCKVRLTIATARTGTATIQPQYWNGTAWTALTGAVDDTTGFSAGTSTYHLQFQPPSDWAQNTAGNGPNAQTGYFVAWVATAVTSYTAAPVGTQGWHYKLKTGAIGAPYQGVNAMISEITMSALTISGTTADSKFLLINTTTGNFVPFTWTKGEPADVEVVNNLQVTDGAELAIVQIQEDGTTEFAGASFYLKAAY